MAHDSMEVTALHSIAEEYDARAAAERVIESADNDDFRVDSKLVMIARHMADANQTSALYSFKVPVSC
jgi:hypothetical protein